MSVCKNLIKTFLKIAFNKDRELQAVQMTHMYGIAITYGVVSLLLLGVFAYITIKMTKK